MTIHIPTPRPAHAQHFRGGARNIPAQPHLFLPYQTRWIQDPAVLKIMEKARRVGISYASAYSDVRRHSLATHKLDTWVSSRDAPTAQQVVKDCQTFAKTLHQASQPHRELVLQDTGKRPTSLQALRFANHTTLYSLASNPDVFAGKGGNVKLDEFALRKDPEHVYDISGPTIDWGGAKLEIISTHRGVSNYFNKLLQEIKHNGNPKNFSHHRVTLEDALNQGLLWKLQTSRMAPSDPRYTMDEATYFDYQRTRSRSPQIFAQEYMCQPEDESASFLPLHAILTCCYNDGEPWELTIEQMRQKALNGAHYHTGIDIGRHHDLTSLTVLERIGHHHFTRHRLDLSKTPFSDQERLINPIIALSRRTCIDNTGLGMQFAERAEQTHGPQKVEKITFTAPVKEDLAYPVRSAIEDKTLHIPNDDDLIADLRAIRKETTLSGNTRFIAESTHQGHADRFWSIALALHAAQPTHSPITFRPIPRPPRGGPRMTSLYGR